MLAAMKHFDLSPWDVVGHHEIQEKPDPGNEFMATIRFLAIAYELQRKEMNNLSPSEYLALKRYFIRVGDYMKEKSGQIRYNSWNNYIGFENFVDNMYYAGNNFRIRKLRK